VEVHTKLDIPHAFVATSEDVTKLWNTLEAAGMKVTATASCFDELVRHFDTCEPVIKYDNPQRAAFTAIEISARSREPFITAEISLGARYSAPISVSLRGDEDIVSSMRTTLTDVVAGMKPWYSRIATIHPLLVGMPIFGFVVFAGLVQMIILLLNPENRPKLPSISLVKALVLMTMFIVFIGATLALCWGIIALLNRFFPVATFAIGQGDARHQFNEKVRWVVIVGFLVSVIGSIVAAILFAVTTP